MANRNGPAVDGNSNNRPMHIRAGQSLGLPSAFPRNSGVQPRSGSRFSNYRTPGQGPRIGGFQGTASVYGYDDSLRFTDDNNGAADNAQRSFTLTDSHLALVANSTLTPTAGEFIPRSHTAPNLVRKPAAPPTAFRSQDGRYDHPGQIPDQSTRPIRGSFDANQRRSYMDDAKNLDRQRHLSEAAALLTSMSKLDPAAGQYEGRPGRSPCAPVIRELPLDVDVSRYRSEGYSHGYQEQGGSNGYGGRTQQRNEQPSRQRIQDGYGKGNVGQGGGENWRGIGKGQIRSTETFASSRSAQGRQGEPSSGHSSPRREPKEAFHSNKDEITSQRERLVEQLTRGTLECLVCCDRIRQSEQVWSCTQCFHVLHLRCVKKWAFTSKADNGWRCPACQFVTAKVPSDYVCFCGQTCDPEWNRQDVPHSCGEVCNKNRVSRVEGAQCVHRCNILCHPGPCPTCMAQVKRYCGCGATSQTVKCGGDTVLLCEAVCGKELNCGVHTCQKTCHLGDCETCPRKVDQACHCGQTTRQVDCTAETHSVRSYACGGTCGRQLACGNHECGRACHEGGCEECGLAPERVKTCPCGKNVLGAERASCLDPVPTCGQPCGKRLTCGQPSSPHECGAECHGGPCPPCPLSTLVRCRCGNMDKEIPCVELTTKADDARCSKKCTKKRACGKHKCNQLCCIDLDHVCPMVCNHHLSCGRHRCEELCHRGNCKPCFRLGWEELYCECGKTVTLPPISCGTRPPECGGPCSRDHPCDHPVTHTCHSHPPCPPCTVFTTKHCYGKHMLRKNVPCYQTEISCGLACGLDSPCGRHKCVLPCHAGPCLKAGARCAQPCAAPRALCGHACAASCHDGACPDAPCKEMVKVTCECGHRSVSRACADNAREYQRIATSLLASKMADMQLGHAVDIADLAGGAGSKRLSLKTLECTEECRVIERNRRLAIGLQIVNPDLSAKLTPRYSEFLRGWAKKDPHFCGMVHTKLTELVQLAKQSKQKSRSYSFEPMNRDKRHFVHELCEHFGCQSEAYDPEPKRNVVATAVRDKAWLPGASLLEVMQRENGMRKIPKPVANFPSASASAASLGTAPNMAWRSIPTPVPSTSVPTTATTTAEPIDYFDFTS